MQTGLCKDAALANNEHQGHSVTQYIEAIASGVYGFKYKRGWRGVNALYSHKRKSFECQAYTEAYFFTVSIKHYTASFIKMNNSALPFTKSSKSNMKALHLEMDSVAASTQCTLLAITSTIRV